jgi:hypothetical protein
MRRLMRGIAGLVLATGALTSVIGQDRTALDTTVQTFR